MHHLDEATVPLLIFVDPTIAFQLTSPSVHSVVMAGPIVDTTVWPLLTMASSTGPVLPSNGTEKWLMPAWLASSVVVALPIVTVTWLGSCTRTVTKTLSCETCPGATMGCPIAGLLPVVPPALPALLGLGRYQYVMISSSAGVVMFVVVLVVLRFPDL